MMRPRRVRGGAMWLLVAVAVIALWATVVRTGSPVDDKDFSAVVADVRAGKVETLIQAEDSNTVRVEYRDPELNAARTILPPDTSLIEALTTYDVPLDSVAIDVTPASRWGGVLTSLMFFLPFLFLIGLMVYMMRQSQGSGNQAMQFGKSRARRFDASKPTVTFADVAGVEEAKEELVEVVDFLKFPERFVALGARIPRGVLLVGPPGTGKTLLSRAVAGEAGVPFYSISGSEFVEMFVGVGASRVRDLFDQAKRNAPCIVFVDEIDAVGRQRGAGLGGSHDEREQTLNQMLVEMDGFDTGTNVIVIAATNRPDVLDPALLRPGRFDRQVILDRPDVAGRRAILDVHAAGKPFESDVSTEAIARQTPGFSGADLENLVNEAAILAARRNKQTIGRGEITEAVDRVIAGPQRKSRVISDRERMMTAYHEAGHALAARMLAHADPVRKVSIVARGMAGGYTMIVPDEDRLFRTRREFEDQLAYLMAGQVAEMLVFEEKSTGASNDIERATAIARRMVTEFGMSEMLGPRAYGKKEEMVFLGRELGETRNYSDEVAHQIDLEVRRLIDTAETRARDILTEHAVLLERIADLLIVEETIEHDQLEAIFEGPRPTPDLIGPPAGRPSALVAARQGITREERERPAGGALTPQPAG